MEWIKCQDRLPEKIGRYLVLETFNEPVICNDEIRREHIPCVSNFRPGRGWMTAMPEYTITHWMEIPEFKK